MPYIPCDEYIGEQVYLIYYRGGWKVEQVTVSEDPYGMIYTEATIDVGRPYWVGKEFTSRMKTLPLLAPRETGKKLRVSNISMYVHNSRGGSLVVDGAEVPFVGYTVGEDYTGKVQAKYGGRYADEPQIEITTDGIYNLRILAIEINRKQYEG